MGKTLVNTTNFPTTFGRFQGLQGVCCLYDFLKSILHYLTSLSDIYVIYLIHMQTGGTVVNGRSTAYHGLNLVLDLNQKVLKFLVFLFNSSLYLSVIVLEPLLMYFPYCSIVQLV